ncbi:MAG: hypothetical protein ACK4YF_01105 [Exilispira sp.]
MYKFKLKKEDIITANLYSISKSKKVSSIFLFNWENSIIVLFLITILLENSSLKMSYISIILFIFLFVLSFAFYEFLQKRWYKVLQKIIVDEKYGNDDEIEAAFDHDDFFIYWFDNSGERKVVFSFIDKFIELKDNIFILLKNKEILIISKNIDKNIDNNMHNNNSLIEDLKEISLKKGIDYI